MAGILASVEKKVLKVRITHGMETAIEEKFLKSD